MEMNTDTVLFRLKWLHRELNTRSFPFEEFFFLVIFCKINRILKGLDGVKYFPE